jgi:3-dehydroquinate synthetase
VGSFAVPFAVVNDFTFLETLPERERRNGLIEAIKVSMIRDAVFFERMEGMASALAALEQAAIEQVVQRSAELHVEHIATGGDPFELGSARPLDFGHWAAHKLEQISGFAITHGEAVAIGMAVVRPVLEKIVILIRRAQWLQWQGSRAARYSINSGQAADAANEAAPPLGNVTSISRVGLVLKTSVRP